MIDAPTTSERNRPIPIEDEMEDFIHTNNLSVKLIGNNLLRSLAGIEGLDNLEQEEEEKQKGQKLDKIVSSLLGRKIGEKVTSQVSKVQRRNRAMKHAFLRRDNIFAEFAGEVQEIIEFNSMIKNFARPSQNEINMADMKFQFYKECMKENVVALPILFKIVNRKLKLYEYVLNSGHCESLCKAFKTWPECIN